MLERIKRHWREFKAAKPGTRFQERYHRRQHEGHGKLAKFVYIAIGPLVFLSGTALLFMPGPGTLLMLVGSGLIAEESLVAARTLDWMDLKAVTLIRWLKQLWLRPKA